MIYLQLKITKPLPSFSAFKYPYMTMATYRQLLKRYSMKEAKNTYHQLSQALLYLGVPLTAVSSCFAASAFEELPATVEVPNLAQNIDD